MQTKASSAFEMYRTLPENIEIYFTCTFEAIHTIFVHVCACVMLLAVFKEEQAPLKNFTQSDKMRNESKHRRIRIATTGFAQFACPHPISDSCYSLLVKLSAMANGNMMW